VVTYVKSLRVLGVAFNCLGMIKLICFSTQQVLKASVASYQAINRHAHFTAEARRDQQDDMEAPAFAPLVHQPSRLPAITGPILELVASI
jgi:hypothetical protein